jgi:acetyltransferase-like isoleucine patch superfamily enzyme
MKIIHMIRTVFWKFYLKLHGVKVGKNLRVHGTIDILLRDKAVLSNLEIGRNVTIGGNIHIRLRKNGKIVLSDGVRTGTEIWLVSANDNEIIVGENTVLSSYGIYNGGHGIKIGADCIFAGFVYLNTSDHNFKKGELIRKQGFFGAPIEIGDDVWVGGHVFINKGVNIGDGAVIGAGSVVLKDVSEYKVVAGNPARVLRDRE